VVAPATRENGRQRRPQEEPDISRVALQQPSKIKQGKIRRNPKVKPTGRIPENSTYNEFRIEKQGLEKCSQRENREGSKQKGSKTHSPV
jgi:hypothetical protein